MRFVPGPGKGAAEPVFTFRLNAQEEALLMATLRLYPVLDNGHHRLSKDPKTAGSAEQRLLEESMAQQPIVFGTNTGVLVLAAFSGITGLLEG
jgi:hypothetical protein